MKALNSLCLYLVLITTCAARNPCKKICIFDNVTCVTRGGFNMYKNVVHGEKGLIMPLDPLHIEEIDGETASVKFKLTKIKMCGLKNCEVTKATVNATDDIYKQYLYCPKLVSHFHFKAQELSDNPELYGTGEATIEAYDYNIVNYGKYSVFVNKDHRPHFFVKTHDSKSRLKGKLVFEITQGYIVDNLTVNQTEAYINQHSTQTEDFIQKPIVKRAMSILWKNTDIFVRKYTMGEIIPEH
ncbi:unnamed protein product [Arctia plantaginis]|uniref:Uncharacterized protein n=1 Tax=Arctia plantaginis TaxID=874455 RepID=A0A8S1ALC0_ARCPL|nr:unnamed protein product [Arctia plantaginis]CAB3259515.1 unnamed protein product [Arctia plantaginis]